MKQGMKDVPTINKFLSDAAKSHYKETSKPLKVGDNQPITHAKTSLC